MSQFLYITHQAELDAIIAQYQQAEALFLDTEFVRTKTFYAQLGLIQAYDGKTAALIDPLCSLNLDGFWALLTNTKIVKVLHSAHEDLEIFAHYGQCQPAPLFDTQIAVSINGLGSALGYAKIVHQLLDIELDKAEARTNWLARPLSDAQLDYASKDVLYLADIYAHLYEALRKQSRLEWVFEEGVTACSRRLLPLEPMKAYLDVKNAYQLSEQQLAVLQELAAWRLTKAQKENKALGFIIKDSSLMVLAKRMPQTHHELMELKGVIPQEKQKHGKAICACIKKALQAKELPQKIDVLYFNPLYKDAFSRLKTQLQSIADEANIPIEMIGSKKLIHQYLRWIWEPQQNQQPLLLQGWRAALCEKLLEHVVASGFKFKS